ncbi:MAG TPA: GAF domain-containing protein [Chloroflexota bacterium]|nr:GAF domain-containing protein [Chloroflexota bacterium]
MAGPRPDNAPEVESRLLQTLYELSVPAGPALHPGELVKLVAERACDLLDGDAVALYVWDDAASLLRPVYSNDPRQAIEDQPLRPGQGAAGQAVLYRRPIVVDDYAHWEHAVAWGLARGLKSVEAVPLMVGDRSVGALIVRFYTKRRVLGPDEERMMLLLAAQVAPALEAARLYAASNVARQHEQALREITQALAANLDERQVLDLAVGYCASMLKAPYARIWLIEDTGELSCAAADGYVHSDTFDRRLERESTSGQVARQQIVNLANAPAEPGWKFNREFGERTGLGAYLGAGLWRAGESLGVLEVMREQGHRFNSVEEQLLVSLANAVAVAVSNARNHAAVERLAREAEQRAEAVVESELLLRSVYEAIGSGVLVFDAQGKIINANAAAEEILGRRVGELLGMRSGDFNPGVAEDGTLMRLADRPHLRAVESRHPLRKVVFGITRPDAGRRWLQVDAVPLFGQDGALTRVILSFIDITDRKRSEEALHQRDAILEAVAFAAERLLTAAEWEHSIDDVLRQLGAATGVSRVYIVPADRAGLETGGGSSHEWTASRVQPRPRPQGNVPYLAAVGLTRWEAILREGGIVQGRLRSFPEDEQVVLAAQGICSLVVVPIFVGPVWWGFVGFDDCREERGWPAGTVEVLKTAAGTIGAAILRRRAEGERLQLVREQSARAEAEAAQRRLAFLAEASQVLALSLDFETTLQGVANLVVPALADWCCVDILEPDGSIRRIAAAMGEPVLSEMSPGARSPTDVTSEHPVAVVMRTGRSLLAPQEPEAFGEGDATRESWLIVPLVTRSGVTGAVTWRLSDMRPAYEMKDLRLAQDLARRCALAIDNARLYREARVAISIRDEFMSVAAHELKTPMTSLRGYAQLLSREFDKGEVVNSARAKRAALTIQVQSDKLARLVGQLLDISRLQSGKLAIERKPADLSALVRDVVDSARSQLKEHVLLARLPEELWLSIDPLRVEQVATNLLDNAIKYSPEGGRIDVSLTDAGATVQLSVQDHGVGVAAEHRPHIFDRFYQANSTNPLTSMAGMGLGLYISREIVELHGGTIEAEFPDEGGTRFVVVLPKA